jgi:glycosyltransferase involved in cell wall biosynthesis
VFQCNHDKVSFLSRNPAYESKTIIIPGNIGGSWFDPEYNNANKSNKMHRIFFLGEVSVRKGIKSLIYAVNKMIKEGCNIQLRIAGKGSLRDELERYIINNGLKKQIIFLGKIENSLEELSNSDLLVVPSIFDSFPNVILESLHVGTPVIGSKSGGIPDMLEKQCLFEPSNEEELYQMLHRLYKDNIYYLNMKKRVFENRKRFYFDWAQTFIDAMENSH